MYWGKTCRHQSGPRDEGTGRVKHAGTSQVLEMKELEVKCKHQSGPREGENTLGVKCGHQSSPRGECTGGEKPERDNSHFISVLDMYLKMHF